MNTILEKIMELGSAEDRACSETERKLIINEAEELYNNRLTELNLLNISVLADWRKLDRMKKRKRTKYNLIFDRFILLNRWKQPDYSRNGSWVIFGFGKWYGSINYVKFYFAFFGLEFCFWFNRVLANKR